MEHGRALLTEREREALAGDGSDSYRYKTRTYLRSRLEELAADADLLREHEPELFADLQAAVSDGEGVAEVAGGNDDQPAGGDHAAVRDAVERVDDADSDPLPTTVDHDDAVEAVAECVEFLREHGPASKGDLVVNVMADHPLGYDAAAARDAIESNARYRGAWWRHVVKPTLEAVDTVETPPPGASDYRYEGGEV